MEYLYKDFRVECPFVASSENSGGVWISSVSLPYRRYPSHVYLFAVLLCLIGYSMRRAARAAGHLFGIRHFSHSTISRTVSRMEGELADLEIWEPMPFAEPPAEEELPPINHAEHERTTHPNGPGSLAQLLIPRRWRGRRSFLCEQLYRVLLPVLITPEIGNHLLYLFWKRFARMLL